MSTSEWFGDDGSRHVPLAHAGGRVNGLRPIAPVQKVQPTTVQTTRKSRTKRDDRDLPAIGWMAQPRRRYVGPGWRTRDDKVQPVTTRHVSPEVMSIVMSRRPGDNA